MQFISIDFECYRLSKGRDSRAHDHIEYWLQEELWR